MKYQLLYFINSMDRYIHSCVLPSIKCDERAERLLHFMGHPSKSSIFNEINFNKDQLSLL